MKQGELIDSRKLKRVYEENLCVIKACKGQVKMYLSALYKIKETQSYMVQYASFRAFLDSECPEMNERTLQKYFAAESVRQNLIKEKRIKKSEEVTQSHLEPLSPLTSKQQSKIFSDVVDKAKTEKRSPTANDFRKAAKSLAEKKQAQADAKATRQVEKEEVPDEQDDRNRKLEGYITQGGTYLCPTCRGEGHITVDANLVLELLTPEFVEAWTQWLNYRKDKKLPKYARPERMLGKLAAMGAELAVIEIDRAITNNWNGIHDQKMSKAQVKAEDKDSWEDYLNDV